MAFQDKHFEKLTGEFGLSGLPSLLFAIKPATHEV